MLVRIDGEYADIAADDEPMADLLGIHERNGSVTPEEYIAWHDRWNPWQNTAGYWYCRAKEMLRRKYYAEHGCCCPEGPDELGMCPDRFDCSVLKTVRRLMGMTGVRS